MAQRDLLEQYRFVVQKSTASINPLSLNDVVEFMARKSESVARWNPVGDNRKVPESDSSVS